MAPRWTDEHDQKLIGLWPTSMSQAAIARELGFSTCHISMRALALGLPLRSGMRSSEERDYLFAEAQRLGMTPKVLREKIVHVVLHDRLIPALDLQEDEVSSGAS